MRHTFHSLVVRGSTLALAITGVVSVAPAQDKPMMKDEMTTYQVTITNMTKGEPFSPPVLVTHAPTMHVWQAGQPANPALRMLAEEGMNLDIVKMCEGKATDIKAATMKEKIMPGDSMKFEIKAKPGDVLTVATMLAASNDAFTGVDSLPLGDASMTMPGGMTNDAMPKDTGTMMEHGNMTGAGTMGAKPMMMMKDGMMSTETMAYDAGSEENTEKKSDTAAPDMGKGHPATDPQQPISMHKGIMGVGDLDKEKMGWTGPVAKIDVKMMK